MRHAMLFVLAVSLLLGHVGCATIVSKTDKDVTFTSDPPGAKVMIESQKPGRYYSTTTPGTVAMSKKQSYFATFTLDGYHVATYQVNREVGKAAGGSAGGNLLLLGILAPVGMGIDAVSGAAATLPNAVHATLIPLSDPPPPNCGDAKFWRVKAQEEKAARKEAAKKAKQPR